MNYSRKTARKGIKTAVVAAFFLLMVFSRSAFAEAESSDHWQVLKGKHFLIHIQPDAPQSALFFAQKVLTEAERFYARIQTSIGHSNQDPWLWEKRCHINLYRDKQSYVTETGRPAWSSASASFDRPRVAAREDWHDRADRTSFGKVPTIDAHLGAQNFLETELPHEIAHLLFRESVGVDNAKVPRWLDEGIALWNERSSRGRLLADMVQQKAREGRLIPVAALSGDFKEAGLPAAWGNQESVTLFYAESYSMVQFLVSRFGQPRFAEFIRSLKNGGTVEESLRKTYGIRFQTLASFENEWQRSLDFSKSS